MESMVNRLCLFCLSQSGSASDPPSNLVMEKQKVFLEELRSKLDLDFDNIGCLSPEEMKEVVNRAVASVSLSCCLMGFLLPHAICHGEMYIH